MNTDDLDFSMTDSWRGNWRWENIACIVWL